MHGGCMESGGVLWPTLEAGVRWDEGNAETGLGVELGAGLRFASGADRAPVLHQTIQLLYGLDAERRGRSDRFSAIINIIVLPCHAVEDPLLRSHGEGKGWLPIDIRPAYGVEIRFDAFGDCSRIL